MEAQWMDSVLIKVLGNSWFYRTLVNRLDIMWHLNGNFDLVDLGHGCYCVRGITEKQKDMILTEGPWQLARSFLSIRKWRPNFRANNDKIDNAITWVRILNLPVEMLRESIIKALATCIGDPIKIDENTFHASGGKFARFCVEVKTDVPRELVLCINDKIYQLSGVRKPTMHMSFMWKSRTLHKQL